MIFKSIFILTSIYYHIWDAITISNLTCVLVLSGLLANGLTCEATYKIYENTHLSYISSYIALLTAPSIKVTETSNKTIEFDISSFISTQIVRNSLRASLQWRRNGRDAVSNHQSHDCLLNRLFGRKRKKISKLRALAFVRAIQRWPVNSPHTWPITRKVFPFDDVIMFLSDIDCSNE